VKGGGRDPAERGSREGGDRAKELVGPEKGGGRGSSGEKKRKGEGIARHILILLRSRRKEGKKLGNLLLLYRCLNPGERKGAIGGRMERKPKHSDGGERKKKKGVGRGRGGP